MLLSRATDDVGSGRYVICRPADDGDFTIPANALDAFGVTSTASFSLAVARSSAAPFCNEGSPRGAATHTLVHMGRAYLVR